MKGDNARIAHIEESIECDVPVRTAYNQWTQFESFPSFMDGIDQVEQTDDTHLHWVASVGGRRKEWDAEIIEQEPDTVVSWRSLNGSLNNGSVTFTPVDNGRCKLTLIMSYQPEDWVEQVGDALGFLRLRVKGDLKRFKEFIESRGVETGSWRGEVHGGRRTHGSRRSGRTPETPL